MPQTCHYCRVFAEQRDRESLLHEDDGVAAFLHDDWAVKGHAVVVWKNHVENISDLSPEEVTHMTEVLARVEQAVLTETSLQRAIIMKLGLAVPHLHLHIFPFSQKATRHEVFAALNNESHHEADEKERTEFTERLRRAMTTPVAS